MWWVIGGVLIAGAVLRWAANRIPGVADESGERVLSAFEALHHRRRVAIAAAVAGPVLIRGKVSPRGEPLTSPLTRRACVYYRLRVDDLLAYRATDHSPRQPSTAMLMQRDAQPFFVTDETGTALVAFDDPAELSFVVVPEVTWSGRKIRESAAIQEALVKLGLAPFGHLLAHEEAIFVGDQVRVIGAGAREVTPDGESTGIREMPMRYVVRATPDDVLAILRKK